MDTNSAEKAEETLVIQSSVEVVTDESTNKSNEDNTAGESPPEVSTEVKEKSAQEVEKALKKCKKIVVGSRYMQSTKDWVNKRTEDSNSSKDTSGSRPPSRNPTPERKRAVAKKSSTPLSTDKSLNVSGISVINRVNENKEKKPPKTEIRKYSKPLMGRKSLAPNRQLFDLDSKQSRSAPITVTGLETQNRNKEFEESIKRSVYLQSIYLNLKAQQSQKERRADALSKISAVWKLSNELRDKISDTSRYVHNLEDKIQTIDVLEDQKNRLEDYLKIRSKVDPLYNQLSQLIDSQRKLFKLENCSEDDFNKIKELLESCPNSEHLESVSKATNSLNGVEKMFDEIKSMESDLKDLQQKFDKYVKELNNYEILENEVFPEKSLSLKKMF